MKEIILNNIKTGYFATIDGNVIGKRGKLLKPFPVGTDIRKYYAIDISTKEKIFKSQYLHRIIWITYNGEIPVGFEINHIDGDKRNCSLNNLEIVTSSENSLHSFKLNLQNNQGENHPNKKINDEIALIIMSRIKNKKSLKSISNELNVSINIVKDISRGKTWQHLIK